MARMKKADVLKALEEGTIVAVGKYGAQRAIVQGVNQRRKVYSGRRYDFGGHNVSDGILVQLVKEDGTPNGEPKVVGPTEVVGTWENYSTTVAAHRAAEEERQARVASQRERAYAAAAVIPGAEAKPIYSHNGYTVIGYQVLISLTEAERLAQAIKLGDA